MLIDQPFECGPSFRIPNDKAAEFHRYLTELRENDRSLGRPADSADHLRREHAIWQAIADKYPEWVLER